MDDREGGMVDDGEVRMDDDGEVRRRGMREK